MSLPTITVAGNLKRLETRFTISGKQVTKFQIECAEKNSKGEWVNLYLSGECWDKAAEFVNTYFNEGSAASVTGKLFTNVYENKDGKKVYENKFLFPSVNFIPKDKASQPQAQQQPQGQQSYQQAQQPQQSYQPQQAYQAPQQPQTTQGYNQNQGEFVMDESEVPF